MNLGLGRGHQRKYKAGGAACVRQRVARFDAFCLRSYSPSSGAWVSYQLPTTEFISGLIRPAYNDIRHGCAVLFAQHGMLLDGRKYWLGSEDSSVTGRCDGDSGNPIIHACQMSDIHVGGPEVVLVEESRGAG
jgi:hypothetical protein